MFSWFFGWNSQKELARALGRQKPIIEDYEIIKIVTDDIMREILAVKLKPTVKNEKPTYYEPRHPVLKELLLTVKRI
jgi:hypothetical protein